MEEPSTSGSSHKGKKLKSYSFSFKLKVVDFAKANSNNKASKTFDIDRKRVIEWRKSEIKIRSMIEGGELLMSGKRKPGAGRKVQFEEIDSQLITWIEKCRDLGVRVTGKGFEKRMSEVT